MVIGTGTVVMIAIAWALFAGSSIGQPSGDLTTTFDPDAWTDVYSPGTYDDPPITVAVQHNSWQIEMDDYDAAARTETNPSGFVGRVTEDKEAWRVITRNSSGTIMDLSGMNRFRDLDEAKTYADQTLAQRSPSPSLPPEGPQGPQGPPTGPVGPSGPQGPAGGGPASHVEIIETASTTSTVASGTSDFKRMQGSYRRS